MAEVSLDLLRELKHLDLSNLNGRAIPFHALHDGANWQMWVVANDKLIPMPGAIPVESCYFATAAVGQDDLHFPFLEFLQQRAYWRDITGFVDGIYADLQNAGASLSKLRLIYDYADPKVTDASRMVVTEIEYIFLTCRSIFDLLQEIMYRLWNRVTLADKRFRRQTLPQTYSKMVLRGENPETAESIAQKFGLPADIAAAYAASAPFFVWLRAYRDLVAHSGHTPEYVFIVDRGFAISKDRKPFRQMDIWSDANSLPNELGSVLSVVAHVLTTTFSTCNAIAAALSKVIDFPPPIAPNHHIFVCGPHLRHLVNLDNSVRDKPWYDAPPKHETPPQ